MKRSGAAAFAWEKNEQIQLKYHGTGTPDTPFYIFRTNQKQDTLATIVMLPGLLTYQSMAMDEPEAITRMKILEKMVQPCGLPPQSSTDQMIQNAKDKVRKGEITIEDLEK